MTMMQIQRIFKDMGIGTETERKLFTDLAMTGAPECQPFNFIRLDDVSTSGTKEEDNAKLAPAS